MTIDEIRENFELLEEWDDRYRYVIVDTGPWIFGRKVMLPAGTVERVDWNDKTVYVDRTKDQIKDSPELGEKGMTDRSYRDRLGTYYGGTYDERSSL